MKSLFLSITLIIFASVAYGQELNATVRITAPKIQTVDPQVFKTMERDVQDFMNNTQWTPDRYDLVERIECSFQINILEEISTNIFKADIAMQVVRPVYGTDYKSAILSHVDRDVVITYEEFQPLIESREGFIDALSSVLTFYAYLVLGYDGDTFSPNGGQPYFQICQQIINNIPSQISATDKGWNSTSKRNSRYWVLENVLSPKLVTYRQAMYQYHRLGLDNMAQNLSTGQTEMYGAIVALDGARNQYPNSIALQLFANSKSEEIIEVFKGADQSSKNKVMQVMRRIDVANANKYDVLRS